MLPWCPVSMQWRGQPPEDWKCQEGGKHTVENRTEPCTDAAPRTEELGSRGFSPGSTFKTAPFPARLDPCVLSLAFLHFFLICHSIKAGKAIQGGSNVGETRFPQPKNEVRPLFYAIYKNSPKVE